MRIGFIQPEEEGSSDVEIGYAEAAEEDGSQAAELGHAEAAANEDDEDEGWLGWSWRVFINFCIVYGLISVIRDLIGYLRAW